MNHNKGEWNARQRAYAIFLVYIRYQCVNGGGFSDVKLKMETTLENIGMVCLVYVIHLNGLLTRTH